VVCFGHERGPRRAAASRGWVSDSLDRLTNRPELEARIARQADPTYVDAAALAAILKSKVVGQDEVSDDLATQIRRRSALQQRGKPIGVFLFAGPPGTGQREPAQQHAPGTCRRH